MRFDVITIFPDIFEPYLNTSILRRARERKIISVKTHGLRDFAEGKHRQVDDKPYGGGAGMVLMAEPILRAVTRARSSDKRQATSDKAKVVVFSAKGKQFNQKMAQDWAKKYKQLIFIAGRYEGIDERVVKALNAEEISIGPYVLTDGDVVAMVVISAITRLLPGAIREASLKEESFSSVKKEKGAVVSVEYPQYTRPEVFKYKGKSHRVPKELLSGNHKKIAEWRRNFQRTR